MSIINFSDLNVWKDGMLLVNLVYKLTKNFPKIEQYSLTSQMQRAATSIPTNISEGFERQHTKEYIQFCYIALGSCAELQTLTLIAVNQDYISHEQKEELFTLMRDIKKMLSSLIAKLKNRCN